MVTFGVHLRAPHRLLVQNGIANLSLKLRILEEGESAEIQILVRRATRV